MSDPDNLIPERAWLIECSRCANEDSSFELEMHEVRGEFAEMGWTATEDGYQYCPACNRGTR